MLVDESSAIPLQLFGDIVIASVQADLSDDVLAEFRHELLETISRSNASGVLIDLSGVEIIDAGDFAALRATLDMASLMGARTVIAGMQPGVVASLIDLGVDSQGLAAVLNLEEGLAQFAHTSKEPES